MSLKTCGRATKKWKGRGRRMKHKLLVLLEEMSCCGKKRMPVVTTILGVVAIVMVLYLRCNYGTKTVEAYQTIAYGGITVQSQEQLMKIPNLQPEKNEKATEVKLTNQELAKDTLLGVESLPNKTGIKYTIYDYLQSWSAMQEQEETIPSFQRVQQQNEEIIEEQKAEKKIKKASKKKTAESPKRISLTEKEKSVLLRIVEAEAGDEDVEGRMLVANVVLNRVKCKTEFPNDVENVVFECTNGVYQFSPILDGRYWEVEISEKTEQAVERVLAGEDFSKGALYFMAREYADQDNVRWFDSSLTWLFRHGNHEFFK